jgi:LytR cell envelope-related transcriptional attenuator
VAKLLARPTRPAPSAPDTTAPASPSAPAKISVTVKNATSRQGLAARATAGLKALGFKATNGGNAPPSATTKVVSASANNAAGTTVARVLKTTGGRVARSPQPGLATQSAVLTLGADFKGVATRVAVTKPPTTRPPKPTPATRDLPPWDPRSC